MNDPQGRCGTAHQPPSAIVAPRLPFSAIALLAGAALLAPACVAADTGPELPGALESGALEPGASPDAEEPGAEPAGAEESTGEAASPLLFTAATNPWNQDVSALAKSASSDTIINWLSGAGGWGSGTMRIDFSIQVLRSTSSTPLRSFVTTGDFYSPDCDHVPFPVPAGGALEGESGYQCAHDGDCHLLVVHPPTNKLYEMWRANITSTGTFYGGCAAVWDLGKAYPANLRGERCTSADAGGFPISAMLFTADEVYAGKIDHAIRFILPNSRIRRGTYVHPGTHTTGATAGPASAPPYGVRFRLRADYPVQNLSRGAQVIARAMQRYGMFLADGGTIALTAQSDRFTTHKWSEVGVDSYALKALKVSDFQVVGMGQAYTGTSGCVRNP